jgi:hypothetical protein
MRCRQDSINKNLISVFILLNLSLESKTKLNICQCKNNNSIFVWKKEYVIRIA